MLTDERTQFDYLLNAMERAGQSHNPHREGYGDKRKALFAYVRGLEALAALSITPAPQPEKYDDVLLPFLTLMRKELHANTGKGDRPGWLAMSPEVALLEVYYHLAKLQKAVKHNDGPAIMEFSADVANMAMMVLDVCGGLAFAGAAAMEEA